MTDITESAESSSRLDEFQKEVGKLRVTGGRANPDRWMFRIGALFTLVGLAFTVVSFILSGGATSNQDHLDLVVSSIFGLSLTLIGLTLIAVSSFKRFMRYWLVRLIYEHREQTDRVAKS